MKTFIEFAVSAAMLVLWAVAVNATVESTAHAVRTSAETQRVAAAPVPARTPGGRSAP